jgi:hypothetical protein
MLMMLGGKPHKVNNCPQVKARFQAIAGTFLFITTYRMDLDPNQPPLGDSFCSDKVAKL